MRAFTLIEFVLVISLLAILAITAGIFTFSPSKARLDAAITQVVSDIERAQQNAQRTGVTSGVQFLAGGSYTVYQGTTATPLQSALTGQNLIVNLSSQYPGVSISTNYTVEFDRFGAPSLGGGASVTLSNGSNTRTVSVTATTGLVITP